MKTKQHLKRLLEEEQENLQNFSETTKDSRAPVELDQQLVGRLSRMDAIQQQHMDLARENRRQARLKIIAAALERIKTDEYGYCLACGEEIDHERLLIDPAILRCLACTKDTKP